MDLHELSQIRPPPMTARERRRTESRVSTGAAESRTGSYRSMTRSESVRSGGWNEATRERPLATVACACGRNLAIAMFDGMGSWIVARQAGGREKKVGLMAGGAAAIRTMRWTEGWKRPGAAGWHDPGIHAQPMSGLGMSVRVRRDILEEVTPGRQGKLVFVMGASSVYVVPEAAMFGGNTGLVSHELLWSGVFGESDVVGVEWWRWWQGGIDLVCVALEDASVVLIDPARGKLCTVRCDITRGVSGLVKVDDEPASRERMARAFAEERTAARNRWELKGNARAAVLDWWELEGGIGSEQSLILTTEAEGCFALLLDLSRLLAWSVRGAAVDCVAVNLPQASPNAPALLRPLPHTSEQIVRSQDTGEDGPIVSIEDAHRNTVVLQEGHRMARVCGAGWFDACATGSVYKRGFGWPHRWRERTMVLKENGQVRLHVFDVCKDTFKGNLSRKGV